jgi:hypothetical protein
LGRRLARGLMVWVVVLSVGIPVAGAWPAGVDHSIFADDPTPGAGDTPVDLSPDEDGRDDARDRTIVGVSLFGSGIFLCSWGITSWEVEEYQCCPARNTGNVVKIVAGVILINAGLIYLLDVMD